MPVSETVSSENDSESNVESPQKENVNKQDVPQKDIHIDENISNEQEENIYKDESVPKENVHKVGDIQKEDDVPGDDEVIDQTEDKYVPNEENVCKEDFPKEHDIQKDEDVPKQQDHPEQDTSIDEDVSIDEDIDQNEDIHEEDIPKEEHVHNKGKDADIGTIELEVPPLPLKIEERLIITKIINKNFKSYAGIQVLGPFHKNFSCIIGPNGSGKSNVIDSMLFVFGYRSSKIRSKKLSVLIHNSEQHPNITSCTVEVCFQMIRDIDDDNYELIPGTDFSISRTATKSNSSSYQINGKTANHKEVSDLLKSSGIDLDHNRFLILQGEVEQISLMKPKAPTQHEDGMLEYLEDIIGTSVYKEPIEELAKTVEELNEKRGEKLNRVKAAEKEKEALEGPKNAACEYIKMDNELTSKKHLLSQTFVQDCNKVIKEVEEKKAKEEEVMAEILGEVKTVVDSKITKETELKKEKRTLDKIVKASEKAKNEFEEFEKRDLKVREDLKHNKAKMKKLLTKTGDEKKKLTKLIDLPRKSKEELEEFTDRLRTLEQDKITKEDELEEVKGEIKPKIKKINEDKEILASDMMEIKKGVNEWQSKVTISQSELDLLTSEKTKKEKQIEEARASLEKVNKTYKEETGAIKTLLKCIPETETLLHDQQNKLDSVIKTDKEVSTRLNDMKGKFIEAKSALAATTSRGRVLEGLLREKNAGRLPGLCGRLGDLGTIDDKYDVAVSTACGALNNIVCEDFETAQKCVEYIRTNNLGTATFIALDKMTAQAEKAKQPIQIPRGALRLYDLVNQKDKKYSGAFYHALRDTLVAPDTDSAKRIAYDKAKRWRVVSLSGVIIDVSGTMSGGGNRVIKGYMSKVSCDLDPKEVDRMSDKINVDQKQIEELKEQKMSLETEVKGLQKKLSSDKFTRQKAEQAVKSYLKQQLYLQKEIPVLVDQLAAIVPDESKVQELGQRIKEQQKYLDEILVVAKEKEDQIKKLDKKILEINEKNLKPCQVAVKECEKEIDKIHDKITKINVALKSLERNKTKVEQNIADYEQELEEAQKFTEELKNEFTVIEEMAEAVIETNETCQAEMIKQKVKLTTLQGDLEELEKMLEEHEKKTVDYKHAIDAFNGIIKENTGKIRHWKKEMSKLSLQHIPGEPEPEPLPILEEEQLKEIDSKNLDYEITVLEETLKQMEPNLSAIKDYLIKLAAWEEKVSELDKITTDRDAARVQHEELRKKRLDEFMTGFLIVTNKLKEMYQMITLGGDAELELVDTLDPFSEGIVFSVRPPKKSWKNISNLSGGEKTLSSLALVFALHHYKPSPLYVMDEIDAALDFKNVSIVAHYIKERTKNAQFIIISLRNNMFELGDQLIGIYKTEDCTKSVTVKPSAIAIKS